MPLWGGGNGQLLEIFRSVVLKKVRIALMNLLGGPTIGSLYGILIPKTGRRVCHARRRQKTRVLYETRDAFWKVEEEAILFFTPRSTDLISLFDLRRFLRIVCAFYARPVFDSSYILSKPPVIRGFNENIVKLSVYGVEIRLALQINSNLGAGKIFKSRALPWEK